LAVNSTGWRPARIAAAQAPIRDHFNQDRHLNRRDTVKQMHSAVLAEWRQLAA
jgi:hypothetical protein